MDVRKTIAGIGILCGALLVMTSGLSQAEEVLTGTHRVISSVETEQGFQTIVEITIQNTGPTVLIGLTLEPIDPLLLSEPEQNTLFVDVLLASGDVISQWSVTTNQPADASQTMPLIFEGEATDSYGDTVVVFLESEPMVSP